MKIIKIIGLTALLIFGIFHPDNILAQRGKPFDIEFADRISFYLNREGRQFYADMVVKEKLLLQTIQSINAELKSRGEKIVLEQQIPFEAFLDHSEKLISRYNKEIKRLSQIVEQSLRLQRVVESDSAIRGLVRLRQQIGESLDDRTLFKETGYPRSILIKLLRSYHDELGKLTSLYTELNKLQHRSSEQDSFLKKIKRQKTLISRALDFKLPPSVKDSLRAAYAVELTKFEGLLSQIDLLQAQGEETGMAAFPALDILRRNIVAFLDNQTDILTPKAEIVKRKTTNVFELFNEWKVKEYTEYQANFTKYEFMKQLLLINATEEETNRMFERDLESAFISYAGEDFELATGLFSQALEYRGFSSKLDVVYFYRGESYFARNLLDKAQKDFARVTGRYPKSTLLMDSYFKLLVIADKQNQNIRFARTLKKIKPKLQNADINLREKIFYLAGHHYLKNQAFTEAARVLSQIGSSFSNYPGTRYLLGCALVKTGNTETAAQVFSSLTENRNYPWSEISDAYFQNKAMLQLGYLAYEGEDYKNAIVYFSKISHGFVDYDKSLLAASWANLKLGNSEVALREAETLLKASISSATTYEALILAAHINQEMEKEEEALTQYRYVTNSYRVLDVTQKYNVERKEILHQLNLLDHIEQDAISQNNKIVYKGISKSREKLLNILEKFQYHGDAWNQNYDEIAGERDQILDQVDELNGVIKVAHGTGNAEALEKADQQRMRLLKVLDETQGDFVMRNRNYFTDYPLTTREVVNDYRKNIMISLLAEIKTERTLLADLNQKAGNLQDAISSANVHTSTEIDLIVLNENLQRLNDNTERFEVWLDENQLQSLDTGFERWADIAVAGVSDLTYDKIMVNDERMALLAQKVQHVNTIIMHRQNRLEQKLKHADRLIRKLEYEIRMNRLDKTQEKQDSYFKDQYFETDDRETETETSESKNG